MSSCFAVSLDSGEMCVQQLNQRTRLWMLMRIQISHKLCATIACDIYKHLRESEFQIFFLALNYRHLLLCFGLLVYIDMRYVNQWK
ncbi:hypothetical protein CDL12_14016 [Handroanthus impetiginosus]|uniref:Uncharacterized protein n=1 Tax=Handroanthus impetiginosus TaxID=429701 RepID=A0A2G9H777_9LAMI|nr:hypothetical protein CDL12_14016 [Handroanthus impetiginosus]